MKKSKRIAFNVFGTVCLARKIKPFNEIAFRTIAEALCHQGFEVFLYMRDKTPLISNVASRVNTDQELVKTINFDEIGDSDIDYAVDYLPDRLNVNRKVFILSNTASEDELKKVYLDLFRVPDTRFEPESIDVGSSVILARHSFPWIFTWDQNQYSRIGRVMRVKSVDTKLNPTNPKIHCTHRHGDATGILSDFMIEQ